MKEYTLLGRVVLENEVLENGAVCASNGVITYVGEREGAPLCGEVFDFEDKYVAPGFVDIHCHAGGEYWAHEDPVAMARHHKAHGTTSILCTIYRGFTNEEYLSFCDRVKEAMKEEGIIKGVHMEGPYLNPKYGSETADEAEKIDRECYIPLAEKGIIKQWTFAPEVEGSEEFLLDIQKYGICPAIGHSCAAPEAVYDAARKGARLVTHLFDATGYSVSPTAYDGTIEVEFSFAAMLCDGLSYEIICDQNGVHVRPDHVRLLAKCCGVDSIVGVTDACTGDTSETDINVVNGELYGSKLTMDKAARNFKSIGFSIPDVFKICAKNPAKVIGLENTGSIKVGNAADLVVIDEDFNVRSVFAGND